jgi:hypothetical protein
MAEVILKDEATGRGDGVMISVALTTAQRDAVREEVESICHLGTDLRVYLRDAASDPSSARWVADWTQQVAVGARLLEQLGWRETRRRPLLSARR